MQILFIKGIMNEKKDSNQPEPILKSKNCLL